jgi:hypothetical protein
MDVVSLRIVNVREQQHRAGGVCAVSVAIGGVDCHGNDLTTAATFCSSIVNAIDAQVRYHCLASVSGLVLIDKKLVIPHQRIAIWFPKKFQRDRFAEHAVPLKEFP